MNRVGWIVFWVARPDPRPSRPARVPSYGPAIAAATTRARHKVAAQKPSIQAWFEGFLLKVASHTPIYCQLCARHEIAPQDRARCWEWVSGVWRFYLEPDYLKANHTGGQL